MLHLITFQNGNDQLLGVMEKLGPFLLFIIILIQVASPLISRVISANTFKGFATAISELSNDLKGYANDNLLVLEQIKIANSKYSNNINPDKVGTLVLNIIKSNILSYIYTEVVHIIEKNDMDGNKSAIENTIRDTVMTCFDNINSELMDFKVKGIPLATHCNDEWAEEVVCKTLKMMHAKNYNNHQKTGNICNYLGRIATKCTNEIEGKVKNEKG